MLLPIIPGVDSNNIPASFSLAEMPHLFLSYQSQKQFESFMATTCRGLDHTIHCAVAFSKPGTLYSIIKNSKAVLLFEYINDGYGNDSRTKFMQRLKKEMLRRTKLVEARKQVAPLIVVLDDVFDLLMNQTKSITRIFFELLISGSSIGMHMIAASIATRRNLLKQMMEMNPPMRKRMQFHFGCTCCDINTPVGAELVYTTDDFIFYKGKNEVDYLRLYPSVQSQTTTSQLSSASV